MSQQHDPASDSKSSQGISLGELTEAFAHAMGMRPPAKEVASEEKSQTGQAEAEISSPPEPLAAAESPEEDCCPISPQSILEAMLFVGSPDGQPLSTAKAAELMRDVEPEDIPGLVEQLNHRYTSSGCPYHIVRQSGGYRLTLRKAFYRLRARFYGRIREARLSQAAIDVLAIVAYQQPLTGEQVSRLRGKPSSHVLAQLVRRGLLRIQRLDNKRRTAQYYTTDRFLRLFAMESLDDLPRSEDIERL